MVDYARPVGWKTKAKESKKQNNRSLGKRRRGGGNQSLSMAQRLLESATQSKTGPPKIARRTLAQKNPQEEEKRAKATKKQKKPLWLDSITAAAHQPPKPINQSR